jgi:hypothetical protein
MVDDIILPPDRICSRCAKRQLIDDYPGVGRRSSVCKSCRAASCLAYDERNREKRNQAARDRRSGMMKEAPKQPLVTEEGRLCSTCDRRFPDDRFVKHVNGAGGLTRRCKECAKRLHYEWRVANADHYRAYVKRWTKQYRADNPKYNRSAKNSTFKSKYGVTIDEAERLLVRQNNQCAVCETTLDPMGTLIGNKKPCLDHCHRTGTVRGFLCNGCNTALGMMRDDPLLLERGAAYVRRHG